MKIFDNKKPAPMQGKFKLSDDAYLIRISGEGRPVNYLHYKKYLLSGKYYFKKGSNKACVFPRENAEELFIDIKKRYPNDNETTVEIVHATAQSLKKKPFLTIPKRR